MKLFIAFSLFAVALAADQVRVVNLPQARAPALGKIDFRPLIIPQSVIDALTAAHASKLDSTDEALRVNFADAPVEAEIANDDSIKIDESPVQASRVNFVDAPVVAEIAHDDSIKIVESPLQRDIGNLAEEFVDTITGDESLKVKVFDAPAEAIVPEQIKIVESVAEESDDVVADESFRVKFVDTPLEEDVAEYNVPEEAEQDDSLRVRIAEALVFAATLLVEQDESLKVHIVDSPVQVDEAVRVVEPVVLGEAPIPEYAVPSFNGYRYPAKVFLDPRWR